jgi:putative tryptophan/tyrosine transport system substrate-binding protein
MTVRIGRREFITLLGGAAAAWPLEAWAQQRERMRRIGVLMNFTSDDPVSQDRLAAFVQGLQDLGWTVGRNLQIDYRWGAGNVERYRTFAAELLTFISPSSDQSMRAADSGLAKDAANAVVPAPFAMSRVAAGRRQRIQ